MKDWCLSNIWKSCIDMMTWFVLLLKICFWKKFTKKSYEGKRINEFEKLSIQKFFIYSWWDFELFLEIYWKIKRQRLVRIWKYNEEYRNKYEKKLEIKYGYRKDFQEIDCKY